MEHMILNNYLNLLRNFMWKRVFIFSGFLLLFFNVSVEAGDWTKLIIYSPWVEGDVDRFEDFSLEEKDMVKAAKPLLISNTYMVIFKEEGKFYLQPKCTQNWYIWEEGEWKTLFYSPNQGGFCTSMSFIKDKEFFLLGKYGFWEGHFDLIKSSKKDEPFEWVYQKNQPLDYQALGAFQTENGIISLFGLRHNPRLNLAEMDYNGFFLDWETKSWSQITLKWETQFENNWKKIGLSRFPHFFAFDLKDYGLIFLENFPIEGTGWYILDKENLEVYFVEAHVYLFQHPFSLLIDGENSFWLSAPNLGVFTQIEVEDLLKGAERVGGLEIKNFGVFDVDQELLVDLTLLLGVLVVGFVWYWQSKTKEKEVGAEVSDKNLPAISVELENVLPELHANAGQLLKQQELDVLLGIHEIKNLDLKKVKRARLIRMINEETLRIFGNPCIERVRSEEDRRMMQYRVDPVFGFKKNLVSPD
ncbi:hypothetical protein AO498_13915 [Algoriphagus sanaruensis]|uniref:Uncharacterized protein n=2 Tax=Algoriphagus sanaruensis TaxID=1727163 RepID=A0A142EQY6_9BACT|nr:hypothetical protein AO498_13915 [Algoriphagus sanaruensis]